MNRIAPPGRVSGRVAAPASKSSAQRAVACALLASGDSILRRPGASADLAAAMRVARALGARMERRGDELAVRGGLDLSRRERLHLDCGESGLCLRMFAPIAALLPGGARLEASGSLKKRPVSMLSAPFAQLGVDCATQGGLPPVDLRGPLSGGRATVDGSESSQFLSGLLVALAAAPGDSELEVAAMASSGYVDLTLATMRAFGVQAERNADYSRFTVSGSQAYQAVDFSIEGDWSGGAFLLVAGAIAGSGSGGEPLAVEGLSLDSAQPDRAIVEALRAAGARVESVDGLLAVLGGDLRGFSFDASGCPDLFPPLAALAARCEGWTELRGARRLRAKESDRAVALREELGALGIEVIVEDDLMRIRGGRVAGGLVDARGDHRIAMAAATLALAAEAPVSIEGADCVAKSWPDFFETLASITHSR